MAILLNLVKSLSVPVNCITTAKYRASLYYVRKGFLVKGKLHSYDLHDFKFGIMSHV